MLHQLHNSYGNFNYNAFVYNDVIWESHFHRNFELIHTVVGETEVMVNGNIIQLNKGEMILIPPYTVHSLKTKINNKTWVGVFSEDYVQNFAVLNRNERYLKFTCEKEVEAFLLTHLFYQGQPERYMLIGCLNMVCDQCIKFAAKDTEQLKVGFVESVVSYVSEHLSEDITLKELSKALGYEYHYFSALFHQNFGMHFKRFIHLFRFEKACILIKDGKTDITNIADLCGFASIRNFNRVFKNISGVTPSEYKKRMY